MTTHGDREPTRRDPSTLVTIKHCDDDYRGLINPELPKGLDLSVENPKFVSVAEATYMRDDDRIVGARFNGEARCYPYWVWDYYHVVNDVWQGESIGLFA